MSSLFNDISRILAGETQPNEEQVYIVQSYDSRAQLERVHLFESQRALEQPVISKTTLARAMVELAGTHTMTDVERNPDEAITSSARLFRTNEHLKESWQTMGKLIENAHTQHGFDLKEMVGRYNEPQLKLLEMTLTLPWRLTYSEPKEVEVDDYAIPGQDHLFKGTPQTMNESKKSDALKALKETRKKTVQEIDESHSKDIGRVLSTMRFEDPSDTDYIAKDIVRGVISGISQNKSIKSKRQVLQMIQNTFGDEL